MLQRLMRMYHAAQRRLRIGNVIEQLRLKAIGSRWPVVLVAHVKCQFIRAPRYDFRARRTRALTKSAYAGHVSVFLKRFPLRQQTPLGRGCNLLAYARTWQP